MNLGNIWPRREAQNRQNPDAGAGAFPLFRFSCPAVSDARTHRRFLRQFCVAVTSPGNGAVIFSPPMQRAVRPSLWVLSVVFGVLILGHGCSPNKRDNPLTCGLYKGESRLPDRNDLRSCR